MKIVGDDKGFQYKFAGIQIPENIGDESEVTKYKDIMTRGRFGEIITKIMGQESVKMFETFKNIIDMFEQIQSKSRDNLKIGGTFEFPSDFDKLP